MQLPNLLVKIISIQVDLPLKPIPSFFLFAISKNNSETRFKPAQLVGSVEYTDCISAER